MGYYFYDVDYLILGVKFKMNFSVVDYGPDVI